MKGFQQNQDYDDDQYYEANPLHQSEEEIVLRMPVKNRIKRLDVQISLQGLTQQPKNDLDFSKKSMESLRNELLILNSKNNDSANEMQSICSNEIIRLNYDLKQNNQIEMEELHFLKTQLMTLTQDRIKLQQNTIVLESKVEETEKDVGFKQMFG